MNFEGKTAIVTGGARGIGLAIAKVLANAGATLVLVDVLEDALAEAAKSLGGADVRTYAVDVTDEEAVEAMVDEVADASGGIHVLVNNAGITRDDLLLRMDADEWDRVMQVNLKGTFLMTKHVARYMVRQRGGHIVNLASVSGLVGTPARRTTRPARPAWSVLRERWPGNWPARTSRATPWPRGSSIPR